MNYIIEKYIFNTGRIETVTEKIDEFDADDVVSNCNEHLSHAFYWKIPIFEVAHGD